MAGCLHYPDKLRCSFTAGCGVTRGGRNETHLYSWLIKNRREKEVIRQGRDFSICLSEAIDRPLPSSRGQDGRDGSTTLCRARVGIESLASRSSRSHAVSTPTGRGNLLPFRSGGIKVKFCLGEIIRLSNPLHLPQSKNSSQLFPFVRPSISINSQLLGLSLNSSVHCLSRSALERDEEEEACFGKEYCIRIPDCMIGCFSIRC